MRRLLFIPSLLFCCQFSIGQNIIRFKISKPYCIFNFLETCITNKGTSATLRYRINEDTKGDTAFTNICNDFKTLWLAVNDRRKTTNNGEPRISVYDQLVNALVNAYTWDDLKIKAGDILEDAEVKQLAGTLTASEKYYDRIVWNDAQDKMEKELKGLQGYADSASSMFRKFHHFYNATRDVALPFTVAIYPVPGVEGNTTATPHGNSLCVGVLTNKPDHVGKVSVALHEACHVLFNSQSKEFRQQLESWFQKITTTGYGQLAWNFFNEAMATCLGNGWAYKKLKGDFNHSDWYGNEYINGFAGLLYQQTESYLENNMQLDSEYVSNAVAMFTERYPYAPLAYGIIMNRVTIYSDGVTSMESNDLMNVLRDYFQLSSSRITSPINSEYSLNLLKIAPQTQLVIIENNNAATIETLRNIFPEKLSGLQLDPGVPFNVSFYDKQKRPIIILNIKNTGDFAALLKKMKLQKHFNIDKALQE